MLTKNNIMIFYLDKIGNAPPPPPPVAAQQMAQNVRAVPLQSSFNNDVKNNPKGDIDRAGRHNPQNNIVHQMIQNYQQGLKQNNSVVSG